MTWYLTGFLWILQIYFWGLGLSLLIVPRRWAQFWPAFCPMVGLALQSLIVWGAAHTALPGTDSYAVASLIIPVGLLGAALWRMGIVRSGLLLWEARKWWAVAAIMAASLVVQLLPFTKPPGVLTSSAIGSCDAADYAAGARVFKEFSSRDRSGFVGNTEVVQLLSVDNFFDFWLRLNHFTPSALIAFNASLFGLQSYEMVSLLGAVLLALNLPVVFWLARSGFRFKPIPSLAVTLIYGFSPILFYAVYQTALGQLLAAPAVALLTWTGFQAFRTTQSWQGYAAYSGLLLICNWLILGSYNFFILFAYIPLLAYLGWNVLWTHRWRRAGHWAIFVGVNLLACALLFPGRLMSLAERFFLFSGTPFGWRMPAFRPDGWYGSFADCLLHPAKPFWSIAFGAVCILTLIWTVAATVRLRPKTCALAAACLIPALCGYAILIWKEGPHDNSSYDAYKLFCVFYPGTLIALCLWIPAAWSRRSGVPLRLWTVALCVAAVCVNVSGAWRFNTMVRRSSVLVDPALSQIAEVERMSNVASINVCLPSYWARMWANYFLLHKPQYFPLSTYEGRRVTPLRGQWDLRDALMLVRPADAHDFVEFGSAYYLLNRQSKDFVDAQFGEGWYPPEHYREQNWCWSKGSSQITLHNTGTAAQSGVIRFSARSVSSRRLQVFNEADRLWEGPIGVTLTDAKDIPVQLPPGAVTSLRFETPDPPTAPGPGEDRALTFALFHFEIELREPASEGASGLVVPAAQGPSEK